MSLYSMLAAAKTLGSKDGDYFNADQQGVVVFHRPIFKEDRRSGKKTVILVSEILEAHAKVADAKVQAPGTKVKKIYAISKRDWAIDELKTDLLHVLGVDPKTISDEQLEETFAVAFEGEEVNGKRSGVGELTGIAANFDTTSKPREGKVTLTQIYFKAASDELNSPEKVAQRREKILASEPKK